MEEVPTIVSFAPVTAREFRLVLVPSGVVPFDMNGAPGAINPMAALFAPKPKARIAELRLSGDPMVNRFEAKAGFTVASDYYSLDDDVGPDDAGAPAASGVNLTDRGTADGKNSAAGDKGRLTLAYSASMLECKTTLPVDDVSAAAPEARTGQPGLFTQHLAASFDYLVVYEPGP